MGRLLSAWFAPLRFVEKGIWNVLLNLGGTLILGVLGWVAAELTSSLVGVATGLALAFLALLVLALVALWQKIPRQALEIRFDRATVQTPDAVDDHGNIVAQARWFHFQVHSDSARGCEGHLILLEQENVAGGYDVVPQFKPPVSLTLDSVGGLKWPFTIEPELPARINLVCSQSNTGGALLCVPSHKASGNLTTLLPGKYRLTVRVSAEGNIEAVTECFLVQVAEMWSGLEVAVAQ